jgi:hypothetical protein
MPCAFTLLPGGGSWAGDGGGGGFDVTTTDNCSWSALTGAPWIHLTTTSGQGSGTVWFTFDANPTTGSRSGSIAIGGFPSTVLYTVTQNVAGTTGGNTGSGSVTGGSSGGTAAPCVSTVSPSNGWFASDGGGGRFYIEANSSCAWSLNVPVNWIHLGATSGTGSGYVSYTVDPNVDPAQRSASINGVGLGYRIRQDASGTIGGALTCSVTPISAPSLTIDPTGGHGTIDIATAAGCGWRVATDEPWLHVAPSSGTGPATITIDVDPTAETRLGIIDVGGGSVTVLQGGATTSPMAFGPRVCQWFKTCSWVRNGDFLYCDPYDVEVCTNPDDPFVAQIGPPSFPRDRCIQAPAGVDIRNNAAAATAILTSANPQGPVIALSEVTAWFVNKVQPHGDWDYKTSGTTLLERTQYRRLGNYNFGYIGTLLGYSSQLLHDAAGLLQMTQAAWDLFSGDMSRWNPSFGLPFFGPAPNGDSPEDYAAIQRGINDFLANRLSTCP